MNKIHSAPDTGVFASVTSAAQPDEPQVGNAGELTGVSQGAPQRRRRRAGWIAIIAASRGSAAIPPQPVPPLSPYLARRAMLTPTICTIRAANEQ